ncbi:IgGFc-binding protein-like [Sander lucioperca]|uniref:IgGFc-binding protein-like n=1 Tax=Sander lucioperca TaxID=283035 RepID=UPI0016534921|nr:IgGFc-binding protein-like [Sander lucioperca]
MCLRQCAVFPCLFSVYFLGSCSSCFLVFFFDLPFLCTPSVFSWIFVKIKTQAQYFACHLCNWVQPSPPPLTISFSFPESIATPPGDSTGLNFIVVFPENIADYHPEAPQNKVRITAMNDNTQVTIQYFNDKPGGPDTLRKGETRLYPVNANMDLWKTGFSNKTLKINSKKTITVQAINCKKNSAQTALVIPTDQLGNEYFIPPIPNIQGTTVPSDIVTTGVTERNPFKLIIVNTDKVNKVTVGNNQTFILQPFQLNQVWVQDKTLRTVKADNAVAVLFGHTCAMKDNCTCGQLYATLPPANDVKLKFYIPPILANNVEDNAFVLLSERGSTRVQAFNKDLQMVEAAGTAIFYRPGLLLTLIPETDFASCYVVNAIPDTPSFALIVVNKSLTDGVHNGGLSLQNPVWQELKGTEYVSTLVAVGSQSVIWHDSSEMAVYFLGKKKTALFGNPAPIISKTPDFRGCVLSPEVMKIADVSDGWRESLKYCKDKGLELVSFPKAQLQRHIYEKILQLKNDTVQEVWIGMRRSSRSGEWYWLNQQPVNDTNWDEGEPGTVFDGQCVVMSLEKGKDFGWSGKDCCKPAYSICYKEPVLFWG